MFALLSLAHAAVHAPSSHDCWAVITGASSGIGAAAARQAAARGFNVLLAARRPEQLQAVCCVEHELCCTVQRSLRTHGPVLWRHRAPCSLGSCLGDARGPEHWPDLTLAHVPCPAGGG